tara:strand:- start:989 stop:1210 length:222 start_codon:yes stop_codon:yes gene_type:complete
MAIFSDSSSSLCLRVRVRLVVDLAQVLDADLGVNLGRVEPGMSEHCWMGQKQGSNGQKKVSNAKYKALTTPLS